jgi:hypothetical protein
MENINQQQAFEQFYSTLTEHEKLCMEKARHEKNLSDLQIQVKKTIAEVLIALNFCSSSSVLTRLDCTA